MNPSFGDPADQTPAPESAEQTAAAPAMWHLCWQAALGREFFPHPSLYARIRNRLIDAHKRKQRVLVDYALLPTEIHVVAEITPPDTAGSVARAVCNVMSRWIRAESAVRSPVLAGPFHAYRIGSADEQREEARMIAWRPVFLGLSSTPAHYAYAAYRIALGLSPGEGFDARPLLRVFGTAVPEQRKALRDCVGERPTDQQRSEWELARGLVLATTIADAGRHSARELHGAAAAALVAAGGNGSIEGALELLATWVAAKLDLRDAAALHAASNTTGARGRGLVACLAEGFGLCSAAEVARHFRRAKSTLSEQMKARRATSVDRPILATPVKRIVEEAVALRQRRPAP